MRRREFLKGLVVSAAAVATPQWLLRAGASPFTVVYSLSPDRRNPLPLQGASVSGPIYPFLAPASGVRGVAYWMDDPTRMGRPFRVTRQPPFDVGGTDGSGVPRPFDTSALAGGPHTLTFLAMSGTGQETVGHVQLVVGAVAVAPSPSPTPAPTAPPPSGSPSALYSTSFEDPAVLCALTAGGGCEWTWSGLPAAIVEGPARTGTRALRVDRSDGGTHVGAMITVNLPDAKGYVGVAHFVPELPPGSEEYMGLLNATPSDGTAGALPVEVRFYRDRRLGLAAGKREKAVALTTWAAPVDQWFYTVVYIERSRASHLELFVYDPGGALVEEVALDGIDTTVPAKPAGTHKLGDSTSTGLPATTFYDDFYVAVENLGPLGVGGGGVVAPPATGGPTRTLTGLVTLDSLTVEAGEVLELDPNASTTVEVLGNAVVRGTLRMRPARADVLHTLRFPGVKESSFVGGGMEPLDSDVGLWVTAPGTLDAAGAPKLAWARATGAVPAGATKVELDQDPVGWQVGDEVAICPTRRPDGSKVRDTHYQEFDLRTIAAVSGRTVTLSAATTFEHPAVDVGRGKVMTAEVLNLTRNVRIEGTPEGRAHVWIHPEVPQVISHVAIRHVGPRKGGEPVLGRYGLHFHRAEDATRGSLVQGVVVRDCGNRGFVPHSSHGITFRDCIAYGMDKQGYWWDDNTGLEPNLTHDTLYDRCVAASLSDIAGSAFVAQAGQGNAMVGCVAVGNAGPDVAAGFAWPAVANLTGSVWRFQDCVVHNNKGTGIFVWQIDDPVHPLEDFVIYHCGRYGIEHGSYANRYQYRRGIVHACKAGPLKVEATSKKADRTPGDPIMFEDCLFDASGLAEYGAHTGGHVFPPMQPTLFERCEFKGHTKAAIAAITPSKQNADWLEVVDCTFEGNEFWVGDTVPVDSFIRCRDSVHGQIELRRKDQAGTLVPEWNARVNPIS